MKKENIVAYVGWVLIAAIFLLYAYGVTQAILSSFGLLGLTQFPQFIGATISSLQAILLANLGMLLGISVKDPNSAVAQRILFQDRTIDNPTDLEISEKIQLWGLAIYIVSLIICLAIWIIKDAVPGKYPVAPFVAESAKMFLGVVLAYATVVFGKKATNRTT